MSKFVPVEISTEGQSTREPDSPSGLKWYILIKRMEQYRERTGMGLAGSWGHVHRGDYEAALESFEGVVEARAL
jgi:hypothetical protein